MCALKVLFVLLKECFTGATGGEASLSRIALPTFEHVYDRSVYLFSIHFYVAITGNKIKYPRQYK